MSQYFNYFPLTYYSSNNSTSVDTVTNIIARFGFELLENILKESSNGKITVLNNNDDSPEEELTKDLVSIINVFSAKLNGMRKYKTK